VAPTGIAGVGLAGFPSACWDFIYGPRVCTNRGLCGLRRTGSLWLKNVWMLGIATGFITDELTPHEKSSRKKW
jgi:hypothetical protein